VDGEHMGPRREPGVIEFDRGIFIVSYKVNKIDEKFDKIMSITETLHIKILKMHAKNCEKISQLQYLVEYNKNKIR